jgi:Williams-Beuren syndrome DDT (WSD), D-TOX E motif
LVARSEPFGMDRHYNRFYCFEQEPEIIAIEMNRFATAKTEKLPPEVCIYRTSWHAIAKKSLLERFASSLDVRGHREKALYEIFMGTGSVPPYRAMIHRMESDCEELPEVKALRAERRDTEGKLEKLRLDIAKIGQEEGRRASRFLLDLEGELESKITHLDSKLLSLVVPFEADYFELTGMATLQKFDARERRNQAYNDILYPVLCADLIARRIIRGRKKKAKDDQR